MPLSINCVDLPGNDSPFPAERGTDSGVAGGQRCSRPGPAGKPFRPGPDGAGGNLAGRGNPHPVCAALAYRASPPRLCRGHGRVRDGFINPYRLRSHPARLSLRHLAQTTRGHRTGCFHEPFPHAAPVAQGIAEGRGNPCPAAVHQTRFNNSGYMIMTFPHAIILFTHQYKPAGVSFSPTPGNPHDR